MCGGKRLIELTPEEAYIVRRQKDLNIHSLRCSRVYEVFQNIQHQTDISETQYKQILSQLSLIPHFDADRSVFWQRFYSQLQWPTEDGKYHYDVQNILICIVQLTSDPGKTKASCVYNVLDLGKKRSLSKAKVELVITLFTQMAVHHLPRLASDYPEENKSKFLKLMMKWNDYRRRFV